MSSVFNIPSLMTVTSDYIHRCFTTVAKTNNFLGLNISNINKILSSSKLYISSEIEVFNAADFWMSFKTSSKSFDRRKFAKSLFLNIRFPLLSDHVTKNLLNKSRVLRNSSSFHQNEESLELIKKVLQNRDDFYNNKSIKYYTNRYCNSSMFNILFCGEDKIYINKRTDEEDKLFQTQVKSVQNYDIHTALSELTNWEAFYLKDAIYFFCHRLDLNSNKVHYFEKYSYISKTWQSVNIDFENRRGHSLCSFIDSIFIIGGFLDDNHDNVTDSCMKFDVTAKYCRKNVAGMNEVRSGAGCGVFDGKVVVCGGWNDNRDLLNSVEAYDHLANTWSYMPNLTHPGTYHNLVSVSNKLFAIPDKTNTLEVYDTFVKKFVAVKQPPESFNFNFDEMVEKPISIGRKLMIFAENSSNVAVYDIDKEEWSQESCQATENLQHFVSFKIPQF